MSPNNEKLIQTFYDAFSRKDADSMVSVYADNVRFSDPVFPSLIGEHARNMWRMLCEKSKNLRVTFHNIQANEATVSVTWEAWYTFGSTGRQVHNVVRATFEFKGGKIVKHTDHFSFWKWSGQALGPIGTMLGWSPFLLSKVRKIAEKSLKAFENSKSK